MHTTIPTIMPVDKPDELDIFAGGIDCVFSVVETSRLVTSRVTGWVAVCESVVVECVDSSFTEDVVVKDTSVFTTVVVGWVVTSDCSVVIYRGGW